MNNLLSTMAKTSQDEFNIEDIEKILMTHINKANDDIYQILTTTTQIIPNEKFFKIEYEKKQYLICKSNFIMKFTDEEAKMLRYFLCPRYNYSKYTSLDKLCELALWRNAAGWKNPPEES